MWAKHQPWVGPGFSKSDMVDEIEWNLWLRRQQPFLALEEGDTIVLVSGGGPSLGRLMWTARVDHLVTERYVSHQDAWDKLRNGTPTALRTQWKLTRQSFMAIDYNRNAVESGWLLGMVLRPIRWLNKPRPAELQFAPNGWAKLDRV